MCPCLPDRSMKCHVSMSHILVYEVLYMSLSTYVRIVMYSVCVSHVCLSMYEAACALTIYELPRVIVSA